MKNCLFVGFIALSALVTASVGVSAQNRDTSAYLFAYFTGNENLKRVWAPQTIYDHDAGKYILMYDVYMDGKYQFTESTALDNFKVIDSEVSMDFHPHHGTVMQITGEEYDRLLKAFPSYLKGLENPVLPEFHADPEILYSENTGEYYIYSTTDGFPGWGGTYFTCYSSPDLFRDGVYYFMWSVDDTGSPNYHLAYGTSDSPLGPVEVAESSVLQLPGTDDWIVVYHRINPAYRDDKPGIHREVCIDRMLFNPDGTIVPVTPN